MFTFIFVSLFVFGWLLLGFIPWLTLSVATRGNAGLVDLPLCLLAAVVAGLAVPTLGKDDAQGLWLSALAALIAPALLLAARRFSLGHAEAPSPATSPGSEET